MPRLLGDVHALLRHFGRERCILVGNDWGGYIAWVFASAYPGRVERLVILNARTRPYSARAPQQCGANSGVAIRARISQRRRPLSVLVQLLPRGSDQGACFRRRCRADRSAGPRCDVLCRCRGTPATTSLRVDVPTLVLWGMQDPVCLPGQLDGLHDHAPNATVVRIEDARPPPDAIASGAGQSRDPGFFAADMTVGLRAQSPGRQEVGQISQKCYRSAFTS